MTEYCNRNEQTADIRQYNSITNGKGKKELLIEEEKQKETKQQQQQQRETVFH